MKNLKRGTIKAYKEYLNKKYGFVAEKQGSVGHCVYGATKRMYGDWMYSQDNAMFEYELGNALGLNPPNAGDVEFKAIYNKLK